MQDIKYGRKRSGIVKELNKKIEDWLSTIDDQDTQQAAKKDVILMGGAIASMLMGDAVNDFDVYFKTKETTIKVAKYYVEKFNKANNLEVKEGVNEYAPFVKTEELVNIKGITENRVCIHIKSAGVAGENPEKYEYFEQEGSGDQEEFINSTLNKDAQEDTKNRYRPVFLSQNAISLTNKFQIVIRFFGDPEKIFESYDFVHAMNYFDYDKQELKLNPEALEAMLSRTLIYKGSLYPLASIWRMKKFINRGWRISAGQQLKIMWQISEINLKDINTVREQLTGVDAAYLFQLIRALESMDQSDFEQVDSTYIGVLIDKIFQE